MSAFRHLSINNKLKIITVGISAFALLLICSVLATFEVFQFRNNLKNETRLLAQIIADRSTAALAFSDADVAKETLNALQAKNSITAAVIFDQKGRLFAKYQKSASPLTLKPEAGRIRKAYFSWHCLTVFAPIQLNSEHLGTVVIKSDLGNMYGMIWRYAALIAGLLMAAILAVYFLVGRLQRYITLPILDLYNAAGAIAADMNFSTQVRKYGDDEVGGLVDAFNAMVEQLRQRDQELIAAKNRAEKSAEKARNLAEETRRTNERLEQEIGERKRAYQAMLESEKKYREIFENAQEGIYRAGLDNRFIDANPAMARILGYASPGELVAAISDIGSGLFVDAEQWESIYATLQTESIIKNFECRLYRKDRSLVWGSIQAQLVRDANNNQLYIEGLAVDITERKHAEESLKKAYQELEQRVEARTVELKNANIELRKAKEAADEASRAKSEFLANMSHEIRTPMNGVISAAEIALSHEMSREIEHYLKIIHSSGNALLGIINDILDFSKIDAGKLHLENHPFRLDETIDHVMAMFSSRTAEKDIELILDMAIHTPVAVIGDALRFQQILSNLMSNAVKFTESNGIIRIRVTYEKISASGIRIYCAVKDTGIGMTEEQRNLLFTAFTQGDTSTTRKFGGTGLGLCISQQLVELMDGEIRVVSAYGQGSEFSFSVKLSLQPEQPAKELLVPASLKHLSVLVVDDCQATLEVITDLLKGFGLAVEAATSAMQAVEWLQNQPPARDNFNLIVVDEQMPVMDGFDAAREIRETMGQDIPVILMSSFIRTSEFERVQMDDISYRIIKPVTASKLYNAILSTFGKTLPPKSERRSNMSEQLAELKSVLSGKKILLVEDNEMNQEIVIDMLSTVGIEVCVANNGSEAVAVVSAEPVDGVLMDIQMPVMDGFEATKRIRADENLKSLPVIAMTASALKEDKEKCMAAGMDGFISKPVNMEKILKTLAVHLGPSSGVSDALEKIKPSTLADQEMLIPDTDVIDIHQASENLGLDLATIQQTLNRFYQKNIHTVEHLASAARQGDCQRLAAIAHSLKGVSSNIVAGNVYKAAGALEMRCRSVEGANGETADINERVSDLTNALNQLMRTIQEMTRSDQHPEEFLSEADPSEIEPMLAELMAALEQADPETVENCMTPIRRSIAPYRLKHLEKHVNAYDYDDAIASLQDLAVKLDITL